MGAGKSKSRRSTRTSTPGRTPTPRESPTETRIASKRSSHETGKPQRRSKPKPNVVDKELPPKKKLSSKQVTKQAPPEKEPPKIATGALPDVYPDTTAEREHINLLGDQWIGILTANALTDCTLVCQGGRELKAHRLVLKAASEYFREEELSSDQIMVKSIAREYMRVCLQFMYTGRIRIEDSVKKDNDWREILLEAAYTLKLDPLVKWCLHRAAENLEMSNYQELYDMSEEYNLQGMISRIISFLANEFPQLAKSKQIVKLEYEQLKRVLQHPEVVQLCMDDIVRAIMRWVEFDSNRKKLLSDLIEPLDLSYLSKDYLSMLLGNSMIKNDRDLLAILVGESTRRAMNAPEDFNSGCKGKQLVCFGKKTEQRRICRIYDVESNEWLDPKTPSFNFDIGMALAGYGHHVYFFGGAGWPPTPTANIIKYCPHTNIASDSEGSLTVPVCRSGAVVCDDSIYVINGLGPDKRRHNVVQRYNPRDGSCDIIAPTAESHLCPHGASIDNCIYIVGSYSDNERSVERYDPLGNQWTVLTQIPGSIEWCRVAFCGPKLYVIRKKDDTQLQVYDLLLGTWNSSCFQCQGPFSNEWGMWSVTKGNKPWLFIRWGDNVLHSYDVDTEEWGPASDPNKNTWHYQLTTFIWN